MSTLLFLISIVTAEFVSSPTSGWILYGNTTMNPNTRSHHETVIYSNSTSFFIQSSLCSELEFDTNNQLICTPLEYSCINVQISEIACPLTNETQSIYLRDSLLSYTVKTNQYGNFTIQKEIDYALSQNAKSIRIYELDRELLLCNDFKWVERKSTDASVSSKMNIVLLLFIASILLF